MITELLAVLVALLCEAEPEDAARAGVASAAELAAKNSLLPRSDRFRAITLSFDLMGAILSRRHISECLFLFSSFNRHSIVSRGCLDPNSLRCNAS